MKKTIVLAMCTVLCIQRLGAGAPADVVRASGIRGGIVVHLGCGDGRETAAMRLNDSYLVHGLDTDGSNIAKAQAFLRSRNLYGPVSVAQFDGQTLPYGDNIVNLLVAVKPPVSPRAVANPPAVALPSVGIAVC